MTSQTDPHHDDARVDALLRAVHEIAEEAHPGGAIPTVQLDSRLDADIGLDSLSVVELVLRIEELFGVSLPEEVLASVATPRELLAAVRAAPGADADDGARATPSRRPGPEARQRVAAPEDATTLVEVLAWHADAHADRLHIRVLTEDGGRVELTYDALLGEAAGVAAGLGERQVPPGASVAIMLPTSRAYFTTFFGVLLAGCVPVPLYPPARPSALEEHLRRHVRILDNARAAALVTIPEARSLARLVAPQVATLRAVVTPEDLQPEGPVRVSLPTLDADATAMLQYTSGSTGDPKGVVLSHANLLANIRAMGQGAALTSDDVFVSWLPLYHDMGLIGAWFTSLYFGFPLVVMSPLTFLARPARWLQAIHEYGGTLSGGPNFGYELCLRRIDDDDLGGIDLGTWRIAFNGAEPVSPDTVTRFGERFAAFGLDPGAIAPVYGLAETSVDLTIPPLGRGVRIDHVDRDQLARTGEAVPVAPDDERAGRYVACGRPLPGHELRIVDKHGRAVGERQQGRIEFRGPSTTSGYFRNRDATQKLFHDDWLDSGDLGYLADGELYVTGRVKDLIIRAGRNLHPSELEHAVGDVGGVRKGCVAVFASTDTATGTERLVVLAETRADDEEERARIRSAMIEASVELTATPPDDIVLAPPGAVPKTSSGKVRRAAARERYERGELAASRRAVWWQVARLAKASALPGLGRVARAAADRLYGAYALMVFALTAIVAWLGVAVVPGLERRWRLVRAAGRVLLGATGIRLTMEGREHLPDDQPFVVAANHASNIDPLVVTLLLPGPAVFTAVGALAVNPLVRHFLRRMDTQLVEGGDRLRGSADTDTLTTVVRSGRPVVFFPEGRRSPQPGLEPFRTGAFVVASNGGAPVVPVTLRGTRDILPVGAIWPRRVPITATVERPVETSTDGWGGAMELLHATRAAILRHCNEPDRAT